MRFWEWFYPGMRLKRWLFLSVLGICMIGLGIVHFFISQQPSSIALGIALCFGGVLVIIGGLVNFVRSLIDILVPQREQGVVNILYKKRQLERGPKIVAIGGGTGLSVLLQGIKEYTSNITAIVTVTDDGGSSGRLRTDFNILPPGDIRNCLVALADVEPLMRDLFQYRFQGQTELSGHSFGNLFITALSKVTGDFEKAIRESSKILAIRGRVVPSTLEKVSLIAEYVDGSRSQGETSIIKAHQKIKRMLLSSAHPHACEDALESLKEADVIILGPGSLYTSIIPNVLIKDILTTLCASNALKIYVCNVMSQYGETDNYKASDYVNALIAHGNKESIDYCIVNTARIPDHMLERYRTEDKYPVLADIETIKRMGIKVVASEIVSVADCVRHDAKKLAKIITDLVANRN